MNPGWEDNFIPAGFTGATGAAGSRSSSLRWSPSPAALPGQVSVGGSLQPVERIRDGFPETWIWLDAAVG